MIMNCCSVISTRSYLEFSGLNFLFCLSLLITIDVDRYELGILLINHVVPSLIVLCSLSTTS